MFFAGNIVVEEAVDKLIDMIEDEEIVRHSEKEEKEQWDYQTELNNAFNKGKEVGKIEGGIEILILDNLEENISKERVLQKLQKRFGLSENEAKKYLEKYLGKDTF